MYCTNCGKEIMENAVVCVSCGCMVENSKKKEISNENKGGNISIVLGTCGIVLAWFLAILGHIVSITGIIVGSNEYKKTGKSAGLILSVIGEVCSVISSIIGILIVSNIL